MIGTKVNLNSEEFDCIKVADLEVCPEHFVAAGLLVKVHYEFGCKCDGDGPYNGKDGSSNGPGGGGENGASGFEGILDAVVGDHATQLLKESGSCMAMHVEWSNDTECGFFGTKCSNDAKGTYNIIVPLSPTTRIFAELIHGCLKKSKHNSPQASKSCLEKILKRNGNEKEWGDAWQEFKDSVLGRTRGTATSNTITSLFIGFNCAPPAPLDGRGPDGGPDVHR